MNYKKKDIDRYFEGKLSKKEAKDFLNWLNSPKGESTYNDIIEEIWSGESSNTDILSESIKPQIPPYSQKILSTDKIRRSENFNARKKSRSIKLMVGVAASFILLLSASYIFNLNTTFQQVEEPIVSIEVKTIERFTPKGNKKIITLPDGSTVVLNAESKLTYSDDFIQNRTVTLKGEGFFDVVRDENHPFQVITGNISTTALGTSFNIKAYEGNPNIQVSLATGKVRVENSFDQNLLEIQPGEAVHYSEDKNILEKQNVDLSKVLGWKDGILQFEKVPFNQIIDDLERWYDVDFRVIGDEKIPDYKCSGTFNPHEYLSNVLEVLSYSVEFDYKINGKEVILEFK
jgi:ferric-dicitrate binding protein FerR (iron transport regulator)